MCARNSSLASSSSSSPTSSSTTLMGRDAQHETALDAICGMSCMPHMLLDLSQEDFPSRFCQQLAACLVEGQKVQFAEALMFGAASGDETGSQFGDVKRAPNPGTRRVRGAARSVQQRTEQYSCMSDEQPSPSCCPIHTDIDHR